MGCWSWISHSSRSPVVHMETFQLDVSDVVHQRGLLAESCQELTTRNKATTSKIKYITCIRNMTNEGTVSSCFFILTTLSLELSEPDCSYFYLPLTNTKSSYLVSSSLRSSAPKPNLPRLQNSNSPNPSQSTPLPPTSPHFHAFNQPFI